VHYKDIGLNIDENLPPKPLDKWGFEKEQALRNIVLLIYCIEAQFYLFIVRQNFSIFTVYEVVLVRDTSEE